MNQTLLTREAELPPSPANESAVRWQVPLKRNASAVDWAHGALFKAIVSLRLPPGEKLSRKHLAKWLGVSLTPLRDALLRLELQRLVETRAQSETRVALIDAADLHALQFERVAMETEIVRRLARRKGVWLQHAQAALTAQKAALAADQHAPKLDLAFHESLFAAAGLQRAFERFKLRYAQFERCLNVAPPSPEALAQACDFHQQLLDRIEAGDAKGAVFAMRAHLSDDTAAIGRAFKLHPQYFT
ncbi:MAG: GntR family transcriptional regulator [Pseudomonadota bacterium]